MVVINPSKKEATMQVLKFNINSTAYESFLTMCRAEDITVKRKINVLISKYSSIDTDIDTYFPENFDQDLRSLTLKVNDELYRSAAKSADRLDISIRRFLAYLIYRLLLDTASE